MKRIFSCMLALCIVFMLIPFGAFAADITAQGEDNNVKWVLYSDGELVIAGVGEIRSCYWNNYVHSVKKATIANGITKIESDTFKNHQNLTEVAIADSVYALGDRQFYNCENLKKVKLPDNPILDMGKLTFSDCASLESVSIPDSVRSLFGTFQLCTNLKEVVLPEKLETLDTNVFYGCTSLSKLSIPAGVKTIDNSAFYNTPAFTAIDVDEDNTFFCSVDGSLYNKDVTTLIKGVVSESGEFNIPSTVNRIESCALSFDGRLREIVIPENVKELGNGAFYQCANLEKIYFPDGIKVIPLNTCNGCVKLQEVYIPSTVEAFGNGVFLGAENVQDVLYGGTEAEWKSLSTEDSVFSADPQRIHYNVSDAVTHIHTIVVSPSCTKNGYTTRSCSCNYIYAITDVTEPTGHEVELINDHPATCTEDGYSGDQVCKNCGETIKKGESLPAKGHTWDEGKVTKEPTEEAEGVKTFTCTVCGETRTEAIAKLTHKHNYTDVVTPPTCTEKGYTTHTCAGCGESYVDSYVDALGHKTELRNVKAATCTVAGYTGDEICSVCGATVKQGSVIKATGHKWDGGKVTKEPTETAEGVKTFTCSVCGETRTEAIPKLTPVTPPAPKNPFVDVKPGTYYYDPVLWAVNHQPQITNGTSATAFSPDATCTRGQVVTFLWRAMGCPDPKSANNPFKDVSEGTYYYKAVLWANENDITNGTSATTFSPESPCTRAHVVTFLWRTANKPAAGDSNPFKDVPVGQYYTDAVLWAVNHNPQITNGTGKDTFSPESPCTRGQIVTFLYRYMK